MTNTTYTASQAATRSKQFTTFQTGMCLLFVKTVITPTVASPYSRYLGDANASWNYAQHKEYSGNPPAGAPVYWVSGVHGHIAVSLGNGYCRSTDWDSTRGSYKGHVGTVAISRITSAWGMKYRGWSRDYAGLTIPGIQETASAPGTKAVDLTSPISLKMLRAGYNNAAVKRFELALWNYLGPDWRARNAGLSAYFGDGYWGTVTTTAMNVAYARNGWPAASYPGPQLLGKLGFRSVVA